MEKAELPVIKVACLPRKRSNNHVRHTVKHGLHGVLLETLIVEWIKAEAQRYTYYFCSIVHVAVGLHVPDDLVTEKLRDLGRFKDKAFNIVYDYWSVRLDLNV
jgi:hypothetical protein